jgi:hypothetical protein
MAFSTTYTVNEVTRTGVLQFFSGATLVSQINYDDTNKFQLDSLVAAVTLERIDQERFIRIARNWIEALVLIGIISNPIGQRTYELKQTRSPDKVELVGELNGVGFEAEWTGTDVKLAARGAMTMELTELAWFLEVNQQFLDWIDLI